jgi:outer membrane protein OmpA-like peptidoglycan-associated protein
MKPYLAMTAAAAMIAGCANIDQTFPSFNREAGAVMNTGDFGNSTMNNSLVQSGDRSYTINLAHRFASEVNTTINFPFNSTALDEEARGILRQQADWIRQFPEVRFKVFGHTDLVGSQAYNRNLGQRRAEAVVQYLGTQGINRSRLEAVVSFGETQPLVVTEGRERRNRRTVTEVSGFVQNHPSVLNGKYAEVIFREYVASAVPTSGLDGIRGADLSTSN